MTSTELTEVYRLSRSISAGRHYLRTLDHRLDRMRQIVSDARRDYADVEIWESEEAREASAQRLREAEQLVQETEERVLPLLRRPHLDLDALVSL